MLPGAVERGLLRLACRLVRRLRARGPLPVPLLVAAGLVQVIDGDAYFETAPGTKTRLPGVVDTPPPRRDAWRRSTFWSPEPDPPGVPPWVRRP